MRNLCLLIILVVFSSLTVYADEINSAATYRESEIFKEPWLTTNKTHQYLGLGALFLGTLTAIMPKPGEDEEGNRGKSYYSDTLHYKLALGATYLGGAALGTGFVFHYKDLSFKNIFHDPDNLHALLATIGTLGFFVAVNGAPNEAHATPGIVGLTSMAAAVKITW